MGNQKNTIIKKRAYYAKKRKMKVQSYKKDERLSIRASAAEKKAIEKKAQELNIGTISDYVISASLNNSILQIDFSGLDEYSKQLSAFGNSLNQITRVLNEARFNERIDDQVLEESNKNLEQLIKFYEENILILQKYHEEVACIRRKELVNIIDPEDYMT